ncbi:MAG: hypothetical protein H7833_05130 [Magnetococcus sp. DMHC-1]
MFEVRLEQDAVWLSQEQMGQSFGRERSVITRHLRDVFLAGELTIAGSDRQTIFYTLDMIIYKRICV